MTNERIKEILLDLESCEIDFTVTQTGKESKRVNGFYIFCKFFKFGIVFPTN